MATVDFKYINKQFSRLVQQEFIDLSCVANPPKPVQEVVLFMIALAPNKKSKKNQPQSYSTLKEVIREREFKTGIYSLGCKITEEGNQILGDDNIHFMKQLSQRWKLFDFKSYKAASELMYNWIKACSMLEPKPQPEEQQPENVQSQQEATSDVAAEPTEESQPSSAPQQDQPPVEENQQPSEEIKQVENIAQEEPQPQPEDNQQNENAIEEPAENQQQPVDIPPTESEQIQSEQTQEPAAQAQEIQNNELHEEQAQNVQNPENIEGQQLQVDGNDAQNPENIEEQPQEEQKPKEQDPAKVLLKLLKKSHTSLTEILFLKNPPALAVEVMRILCCVLENEVIPVKPNLWFSLAPFLKNSKRNANSVAQKLRESGIEGLGASLKPAVRQTLDKKLLAIEESKLYQQNAHCFIVYQMLIAMQKAFEPIAYEVEKKEKTPSAKSSPGGPESSMGFNESLDELTGIEGMKKLTASVTSKNLSEVSKMVNPSANFETLCHMAIAAFENNLSCVEFEFREYKPKVAFIPKGMEEVCKLLEEGKFSLAPEVIQFIEQSNVHVMGWMARIEKFLRLLTIYLHENSIESKPETSWNLFGALLKPRRQSHDATFSPQKPVQKVVISQKTSQIQEAPVVQHGHSTTGSPVKQMTEEQTTFYNSPAPLTRRTYEALKKAQAADKIENVKSVSDALSKLTHQDLGIMATMRTPPHFVNVTTIVLLCLFQNDAKNFITPQLKAKIDTTQVKAMLKSMGLIEEMKRIYAEAEKMGKRRFSDSVLQLLDDYVHDPETQPAKIASYQKTAGFICYYLHEIARVIQEKSENEGPFLESSSANEKMSPIKEQTVETAPESSRKSDTKRSPRKAFIPEIIEEKTEVEQKEEGIEQQQKEEQKSTEQEMEQKSTEQETEQQAAEEDMEHENESQRGVPHVLEEPKTVQIPKELQPDTRPTIDVDALIAQIDLEDSSLDLEILKTKKSLLLFRVPPSHAKVINNVLSPSRFLFELVSVFFTLIEKRRVGHWEAFSVINNSVLGLGPEFLNNFLDTIEIHGVPKVGIEHMVDYLQSNAAAEIGKRFLPAKFLYELLESSKYFVFICTKKNGYCEEKPMPEPPVIIRPAPEEEEEIIKEEPTEQEIIEEEPIQQEIIEEEPKEQEIIEVIEEKIAAQEEQVEENVVAEVKEEKERILKITLEEIPNKIQVNAFFEGKLLIRPRNNSLKVKLVEENQKLKVEFEFKGEVIVFEQKLAEEEEGIVEEKVVMEEVEPKKNQIQIVLAPQQERIQVQAFHEEKLLKSNIIHVNLIVCDEKITLETVFEGKLIEEKPSSPKGSFEEQHTEKDQIEMLVHSIIDNFAAKQEEKEEVSLFVHSAIDNFTAKQEEKEEQKEVSLFVLSVMDNFAAKKQEEEQITLFVHSIIENFVAPIQQEKENKEQVSMFVNSIIENIIAEKQEKENKEQVSLFVHSTIENIIEEKQEKENKEQVSMFVNSIIENFVAPIQQEEEKQEEKEEDEIKEEEIAPKTKNFDEETEKKQEITKFVDTLLDCFIEKKRVDEILARNERKRKISMIVQSTIQNFIEKEENKEKEMEQEQAQKEQISNFVRSVIDNVVAKQEENIEKLLPEQGKKEIQTELTVLEQNKIGVCFVHQGKPIEN